MRTLKVIFDRMDFNGNGKLDFKEFEAALGAFGLFLKVVEIQALIKYYDKDGDGSISYEEFISGLREELSERRKKMVFKAFRSLDKNNSGFITMSDIRNLPSLIFLR